MRSTELKIKESMELTMEQNIITFKISFSGFIAILNLSPFSLLVFSNICYVTEFPRRTIKGKIIRFTEFTDSERLTCH